MTTLPALITPGRWLARLFSARGLAEDGVVRHQVRDVERLVGGERFLSEVRRRGYRAVESAGLFVVFCNRDPVRLLD